MKIDARFNGPPASGHGGTSCGLVAAALDVDPNAAVEVTLRAPPPLGVEMDVVRDGGALSVSYDGTVVATARQDATVLQTPPSVPFDEAAAVAKPNEPHPFPTCFACGPDHPTGLHLFTAAVPGRDVAAAPWQTDESLAGENGFVRPEIVWAALDCPSGWSYDVLGQSLRASVLLGRMTAQILTPIEAGSRCVVTARPAGGSGRKWSAISAVYGEDGALHGVARVLWIVLQGSADPARR
jgi:hypothetical protein